SLWVGVEDDGAGLAPALAADVREGMRARRLRRKDDDDGRGQGNGLVEAYGLLVRNGCSELEVLPNDSGKFNRFQFQVPVSLKGERPPRRRVLVLGNLTGDELGKAADRLELDLVQANGVAELGGVVRGGPIILVLAADTYRELLAQAQALLSGVPAAVVVQEHELVGKVTGEVPVDEVPNLLYRASRGMDVPIWMSLGLAGSE